jgi:very-short-patch-repair endonuclease
MPRRTGPDESERRATLGALSNSQRGLFTRDQAIAAGYPRSTIAYRLRTHDWDVVDYAVYRVTGTPDSWHQRLLAACLAGPAVASHRAAAVLWHAPGISSPVEVTVIRHRRRSRRPDVTWHESTRLEPYERRIVEGIPVTEPARTLLDLASLGDEHVLVTTFDDFIGRGLTSFDAIYRRIEQLGELRRGAKVMRALLERRRPGHVPESVVETEFAQLLRRAGLPDPVPQFVVRDDGGAFVGRVDFAYPAERVLIEIQSTRWHNGPEDRERDDRRHARMGSLRYHVVPIGTGDLRARPDEVVATIRTALKPRT